MTPGGTPGRLYGKFSQAGRVFVAEVRGTEAIELDTGRFSDLIDGQATQTGTVHTLSKLKTLAPVDRPGKIICIGLNYRSHIAEMKWETPKVPIIFTKPWSALIGPGDAIELPSASSRVDYEGESAVIIGSRARRATDGLSHIFGYTCFDDVTARDLQKADPDWTRAKGFDTFAPIGPYVSTAPPSRVKTRLNGRMVQDMRLSDRVFGDAALVEYISTVMTLEPGDIIATGTPAGISPIKAGDTVEVELDGIGTLSNPVVDSRGRQ